MIIGKSSINNRNQTELVLSFENILSFKIKFEFCLFQLLAFLKSADKLFSKFSNKNLITNLIGGRLDETFKLLIASVCFVKQFSPR